MLYRWAAPDRYGGFFPSGTRNTAMPNTIDTTEQTEPVGIVISRGNRDEPTPAFFAFVWGAAPEDKSASERAQTPRAA